MEFTANIGKMELNGVSEEQSNFEDEELFRQMSDKWKLISRLGSGGMSTVYQARDLMMQRDVAIKVMLPHLSSHGKSVMRFQHEAKAAGNLKHPNLIHVYDCNTSSNGRIYLVMEYVRGRSLSQLIKQEKKLSLLHALPIFLQIGEGLQHAHDRGIIHRDLKPSNIMVSQDTSGFDQVKLVDFGIAKLYSEEEVEHQTLTQTGEMLGSPLYMSPEQCSGGAIDIRADIYSFGCLMYEALSGLPPLIGINAMDTMQKHCSERPKSLSPSLDKSISAQKIDAIVMRCLAKDPNERYQTVGDLLKEIEFAARKAGRKASLLDMLSSDRETLIKRLKISAIVAFVLLLIGVSPVIFVGHSKLFAKPIWHFEPATHAAKAGNAEAEFNNMKKGERDNDIDTLSITPTEKTLATIERAEKYFEYNKFMEAAGLIDELNPTRNDFPPGNRQKLFDIQAQCYYSLKDYRRAADAAKGAVKQALLLSRAKASVDEHPTEYRLFTSVDAQLAEQSLLILESIHEKAMQFDLARENCLQLESVSRGGTIRKRDWPSNMGRANTFIGSKNQPIYSYPWCGDGWTSEKQSIVAFRSAQADLLRLSLIPHVSNEKFDEGQDPDVSAKEDRLNRADAAIRNYQLAFFYELAAANKLDLTNEPTLLKTNLEANQVLYPHFVQPIYFDWKDLQAKSHELSTPIDIESAGKIFLGAAMTYENVGQLNEAQSCLDTAEELLGRMAAESQASADLSRAVRQEQVWVNLHKWNLFRAVQIWIELNRDKVS